MCACIHTVTCVHTIMRVWRSVDNSLLPPCGSEIYLRGLSGSVANTFPCWVTEQVLQVMSFSHNLLSVCNELESFSPSITSLPSLSHQTQSSLQVHVYFVHLCEQLSLPLVVFCEHENRLSIEIWSTIQWVYHWRRHPPHSTVEVLWETQFYIIQ